MVFVDISLSLYLSLGLIVVYLSIIKSEPYLEKYYELNTIDFNTHIAALITIYISGYLNTDNSVV